MQIKTMTLLFDQLLELQEHFGRNIYQFYIKNKKKTM